MLGDNFWKLRSGWLKEQQGEQISSWPMMSLCFNIVVIMFDVFESQTSLNSRGRDIGSGCLRVGISRPNPNPPHRHLHPLALCTNNRFDPASETFTQTLVQSADPILAGNEGTVHAFDPDGRVMYVVDVL